MSKGGSEMYFTIPKPIISDFERLNALIEENPIYIPIARVADYLGMNPESLRCAIDQGRATFGFSWKSDMRGNRAFKVPTIAFYNWVMQGHATQFIHEYTEGKN